jgi:hypothetical protein
VIDDDYDSEFRYDREPVGVLAALARHPPGGRCRPTQLMLGFGQVPERVIEPGIAAVADVRSSNRAWPGSLTWVGNFRWHRV